MPRKQSDRSKEVAAYVGPIIKRARLAAGMTKAELGFQLGLTLISAHVTVHDYEEGRTCPSLPRLFDIAAALGLPPQDLLEEAAEFQGA